ncbi:MAG: tetratricopeptide repeat protein [Chthoniobacteraceae bacterium]
MPAASSRIFLTLLFLFVALACNTRAADTPWSVVDAPYRATVTLQTPAKFPDAGIAIQLPEFGQTRPDLGDVLLLDAKGRMQPLAATWRGEGQTALLLAKELNPGQQYYLYFGGGSIRSMQKWEPKTSLLMETRRLPENAKFDAWPDMQKTWNAATVVDGAGFVPSIYQAANPFGESANFVTHYTGWLQTSGSGGVTLYTLSSDASFVLVNDQFEFAWPGIHSPRADTATLHSKKIPVTSEFTRIDYYHAKVGNGDPATVLGWQRNGKTEAIPPDAWLHPGTAQLGKIEQRHGWPIPIVKAQADSYIGYADQWFFDAKFTLPDANTEGWTVEWQFDDGATVTGTDSRRIIVESRQHTVTVKLHRGNDVVSGEARFTFPDNIYAASINNPGDMAHYLDLLATETPSQLSKPTLNADMTLLCDFGTDTQIAKFATAWLSKNPTPDDPLWLPAQLARLRALASSDPKQALAELRAIDPLARNKYALQFNTLELDFMVFYLHDPAVADLANRMAFANPNSDSERIAKIRVGDSYRLAGHYPQAAEQYQSVQKMIVDESGGRKLPAQDQAYSITIKGLIDQGLRREASAQLQEWESKHPMAKLDSDYLLLRGRLLNEFGRWDEALAELDSFKKMQPDSPYCIDADFYRAQAIDGLGRKDEAQKIWNQIAKDYPNHDLAPRSKALAAKP